MVIVYLVMVIMSYVKVHAKIPKPTGSSLLSSALTDVWFAER